MIGVILAAGMGTRLRPLTNEIPKPLLKINDLILLERMIKNCVNENIIKFIVITGYYSDKTDEVCMFLSKKYNIQIKTIKNEQYNETNTSVSTYLASNHIQNNTMDDFILINGDNIVDPKIIHKLCESETTSMVVDNVKNLNEESFKLIINQSGIITAIGKDISIEQSTGEFIGISKVNKEDLSEFNRILKNLIDENYQNYYDLTFKELSNKTNLTYVYTDGLRWTEIDDFYDYEVAEDILNQLENE